MKRHTAFFPRKSTWAKGARHTVQWVFRQYMQRYTPSRTRGVADVKYEKWLRKQNRYRNRDTVGMIRAFGAPNFFRGAYIGAENE